MESPASSPAVG